MATRSTKELMSERNITVVGGDIFTTNGFTQVPNVILRHPALNAGEKLAYTILLSYAWEKDSCFPGQDRLAEDMGVSRASANTYVKGLAKKKFIEIKRRGQGRSNLYVLNLKAKVLKTKT